MAEGAFRREGAPRMPYARHVTDAAVALDSGALMTSFQLAGVPFETLGPAEIAERHEKLNLAWRNLADARLAVWTHLVRRPVDLPAATGFRSAFAAGLAAGHAAALGEARMYANDLYLTLVLRPPGRRAAEADSPADLARLETLAHDLQAQLAVYAPRRLGLYERSGLWFSELAELLRLLLTGQPERVPLVRGHLGAAVHTARLIFGREALEIRAAGETRYAGMLGLKEYPATTRAGLWDALLAAPFPLTLSQSFAVLAKPAAQAVLARKQNQMASAGDKALSQAAALTGALDALTANAFVMGEHQASLLVSAPSPPQLAERLARARALLADSGLVAAREDLGLEAAFWAQFPGNAALRSRPAAITSRNFAAFAGFHAYPTGAPAGHHWGEAVATLRSPAGTPLHLSLHVADLGHTFICGPSGGGKTVLQTFLLAQLERLGAQRLILDKDRGCEPFVRACGGAYLTLQKGRPSGFSPLKALAFTAADRAFLRQLIEILVGERPPLTPEDRRAIARAVDALAPLPPGERSLAALRPLLPHADPNGIGARLERWCAPGPLGWALDDGADALALDAPLIGLDITELLDQPETRTAMLLYLFHRLAALRDGRRLVIDIDEFWKALGDPAFRGLAEDGLKTFRKQNALLILATQSPADVLASPIAHTLVEQCATQIFLPNGHATARDYVEGFGLSARELQLVRDELTPQSRRFLVKQGGRAFVAELNLDGRPELAALARRAAD